MLRVVLVPTEGGRPVELGRDLTLVGRSEEADLKLDHKSVSKLHCVLVRSPEGLLVRDLGSTNGTRINGQRVRRGALIHDDVLNLAHYSFRVEIGEIRNSQPTPQCADNATMVGNVEDFESGSALDHPSKPNNDREGPNYSRSGNVSPPRVAPPRTPPRSSGDSSVRLASQPPGAPTKNPLPDAYDD